MVETWIRNKTNPFIETVTVDGIEAAEEILQKRKIPIAYMTGYATEFIKERAMKTGPIAFLEKPVTTAHIKAIFEEMPN